MITDLSDGLALDRLLDLHQAELDKIRQTLTMLRFGKQLNFSRRLPFRRHRSNIDRILDETLELTALLNRIHPALQATDAIDVVSLAATQWPKLTNITDRPPRIDVIIPVYRGLKETLNCLYSVLSAKTMIGFEIIVIDDCSPEATLSASLAELANHGRITLLRNTTNLGFVQTVNRGMVLHPDRDVVLLNSDTLVYDGWLDRLALAAASGPKVGTVTPLSNTAGIFSYPNINLHNPVPADISAGNLNAMAARLNAGGRFATPTAVGFCMYIRRECIRDTGVFDADRFGHGYGEENDFSLRATRKGWMHLGAADVFVYHVGNVSFGAASRRRVRDAYRMIKRLHPQYPGLVKVHLLNNPGLEFWRRLDIGRIQQAATGRPAVLHVIQGVNGPIDRHVTTLTEALWQDGIASVIVRQDHHNSRRIVLSNPRVSDTPNSFFHIESEREVLLTTLRGMAIHHVHYHDLPAGWPLLRAIPAELCISYDITLYREPRGFSPRCHDGAPADAEGADFLSHAHRVMVSDSDMLQRIATAKPGIRGIVQPYFFYSPQALPSILPTGVPHVPPTPLRVLVFLTPGNQAALQLIRECLHDAARRHLQLKFLIFGAVRATRLKNSPLCEVFGPIAPRHLHRRMMNASPHLALLPPDNTLALSEALWACVANAVMPVACHAGGVADHLRKLQWGISMPVESSCHTINDILISTAISNPPSDLLARGFHLFPGARSYYDGVNFSL